MALNDWVTERARELASLRGRRVESWVGVEMALRERAADGNPQFSDPQVPCLQLDGLQAALDGGDTVSITTYQDDFDFGLLASSEARFDDERWTGIFRWRPLTELPTGVVEQVGVFADKGVLAEVRLRIGGRPLLLVAGELEETHTDRLLFHRLDESVLAFTDPAPLDYVPWTTSRRGLAPIHRDV